MKCGCRLYYPVSEQLEFINPDRLRGCLDQRNLTMERARQDHGCAKKIHDRSACSTIGIQTQTSPSSSMDADRIMPDTGFYNLSSAARLTRLHPSTARAWFRGRSDGKGRGPVLRSSRDAGAGGGRSFAIGFLDLIDLLVAGRLRAEGVKLPTIRRAYDAIGRDLATDHPFSHEAIYTDGRDVLLRAADEIDETRFHNAVNGQNLLPCMNDLVQHIDFDETSRLAERWRVAEGVTIDPAVMWGEPTISGRRVTASLLANQLHANDGDIGVVADLYEVDESDVRHAAAFAEHFKYRPAA